MKPGPKKGYKQTSDHIAKRKRFGPAHPNWKGDRATVRTGRGRAERLYPVIGPCIECGNPKSERHHRDGNTLNNESDNIVILCRKCHMRADGRLEKVRNQAKRQQPFAVAARWN